MEEQRIVLAGEYDLTRKEELGVLFGSLEGSEPLVIDIEKVTYVDSTALGELSALRNRHPRRRITLSGASPNIRRILSLVNFESVFHIT